MLLALDGLAALLAQYGVEQPALRLRAFLDSALVQPDGAHLRLLEMTASHRLGHRAIIAHAANFSRRLAQLAGQLFIEPVLLAQRLQPGRRFQPDFARGEFEQRILENALNVLVSHVLNTQ